MAIKKHFLASVAALTLLGAGGGGPPDPPVDPNAVPYYNTLLPLLTRTAEWGLRPLHEGYTGNVVRTRDVVSNVETDQNVAALAAYVPPFQTAFSVSNLGDTPDWVDYTLRMRFTAANIGKGRFCKFAIKAHSTQGLTVDEVWLHRGTGTSFEAYGEPIRILFSGSGGFVASPGATITCDEFELPIETSFDNPYWILSIHSTAGGYDRTASPSGQSGGYKTGNLSKDLSGSGWNTSGTTGNVVNLWQTRLFPAVVTIYDQTGNGSHLGQSTASLQGLLDMHRTGSRKPAIIFDGVDDYYRDVNAASTTRPYMVAAPMVIGMFGARIPREQWGKFWGIPHADGANSTPYARMCIEYDAASNLLDECQVRVDSTQTTVLKCYGWNNRKGWSAHALVPVIGGFLQAGAPRFNVSTDSTTTYPNATRMYLAANGQGTENNGMHFCELVMFDAASVVEADIQNAIDKIGYALLFGPNRYYRMTTTGSFDTVQTDAGFAEIEFHKTIGGSDLSDYDTPFVANKNASGEQAYKGINNNTADWFSSGNSPAVQPLQWIMLNENSLITELKMIGRPDTPYFRYQVKKYILARFTATGWESAAEVDNTADGNVASQVYVDPIMWPRAAGEKQSAAYWRMRVHIADGDNVQLGEFKFKNVAGDDLCVGGTLLYSSQYNSGTPYFGAANAVDKNLTTGWAASGFAGQWIGYQFAAPAVVDKFQFNASQSYPSLIPKSICIDYSLDGTVWKPYDGWRNATSMTGSESREVTLTPPDKARVPGKHRFWRVRPMGTNGSTTVLARMWLWGAGGVAGGVDTIISAGGSAVESGHQTTWYNTFLWERSPTGYSYGWQAPVSEQNVPGASWVGWDFGAGNEQEITAISLAKYSSNEAPRGFFVEYSDNGSVWIVRDSFCTEWTGGSYEVKNFTFAA